MDYLPSIIECIKEKKTFVVMSTDYVIVDTKSWNRLNHVKGHKPKAVKQLFYEECVNWTDEDYQKLKTILERRKSETK